MGEFDVNVFSIAFDRYPGIGAYYGPNEGNAQELLTYAANRGMMFWDCADIYGSCE